MTPETTLFRRNIPVFPLLNANFLFSTPLNLGSFHYSILRYEPLWSYEFTSGSPPPTPPRSPTPTPTPTPTEYSTTTYSSTTTTASTVTTTSTEFSDTDSSTNSSSSSSNRRHRDSDYDSDDDDDDDVRSRSDDDDRSYDRDDDDDDSDATITTGDDDESRRKGRRSRRRNSLGDIDGAGLVTGGRGVMTAEESGAGRHGGGSKHRKSRRHRRRDGSASRGGGEDGRSSSRRRGKSAGGGVGGSGGLGRGYANYGFHHFGSSDWTMQLDDPIMSRQIRKFSAAPPSAFNVRDEFYRGGGGGGGGSGGALSSYFRRGLSGSRMSLHDFGDSFGAVYLGKVATDLMPDDSLQNRVAEALLRKEGVRSVSERRKKNKYRGGTSDATT